LTNKSFCAIIQTESKRKGDKKMTVNEMIQELQKLADRGYGDAPVRLWDDDFVESVEEDHYNNDTVIVY
jgi:hypothetical protein